MPRPLKSIKQTKQNIYKKVIVALSGGVDSSVAAYLLKKQGYDVVGAFIKIWVPGTDCDWKEDRRSAMRVAAHLDIPFITIDLSKEYKREVVDYMIREYKAGRTPNPDVMCNKEIKFGVFLRKAMKLGAERIATGHYAQTDGKNLYKAKDRDKEQSYFLWTLTQKELSKTLLPIGHLTKSEVREIARKAGLHTFERKDSQGLCFIGKVNFKDFLKRFIKEKKGAVLNINGEIIGYHNGATFLTLGERHGFTITRKSPTDKPMYIVAKNIKTNTITVAHDLIIKSNKAFVLDATNWINGNPKRGKVYTAHTRYHQDDQKCKILRNQIIFGRPQVAAPGQSIVIYDGDTCLGGGVIR